MASSLGTVRTGPPAPGPDEFRFRVVVPAAIAMGGVGMGAAWVLLRLIWLLTNVLYWHRWSFRYAEAHTAPTASSPWTVVILVAGALLAGLAVRYGHESLRGHGIPEVMEAVVLREGRIPPRVAVLKPLLSALVIGGGAPFGAEGPIIQTGGAIGSLIGQWLPVSAAERKVLIACGAAAGMTGVFGTPLAAVLLPVELITFEFSLRALAPPALAAGVAAVLRVPLLGAAPLFAMGSDLGFGAAGLVWCLGFGVVAGLQAVGITRLLYGLEDLYERVPGAGPVVRPVIGAVCVGVIALAGPEVLGVGYDLIRAILNGQVPVLELWRIFAFKSAGWLLALASGTVGGVLAPLFMIAGATGALLGHALQPWSGLPAGLVALVFMAAVFGAGGRAILTASVFAVEVTGDFHALVGVLVATAVATALADRLLPYNIMTGKLVRRGLRLSHDYFAPAPVLPAAAARTGAVGEGAGRGRFPGDGNP